MFSSDFTRRHFCPTLHFFEINILKKTIFFELSQISSQIIPENFKLLR